jgi:cholesterol transport system auxiliary component
MLAGMHERRTGQGRMTGRLGIAGLLALGLGACASIIPKTPDTIYDLAAPKSLVSTSGTRLQILVPEPGALKSLDTERIAARPTDIEYAYLPGAVWSDRLPKLLQTRLMETLQNTGRVKAVGIPGQGLLIDYQIVMDVRSFEIFGDDAIASFSIKLMNDRNGRVLATRIVEARAPVSGSANSDYVDALNAAMEKAFGEITGWVLSRI